MIASFKSRALKRFWTRNDASGCRPERRTRVQMILDRLDALSVPKQMDWPGLNLHALTGDRLGTYSVLVSRNWRLTFCWNGDDANDVALEGYHGR